MEECVTRFIFNNSACCALSVFQEAVGIDVMVGHTDEWSGNDMSCIGILPPMSVSVDRVMIPTLPVLVLGGTDLALN